MFKKIAYHFKNLSFKDFIRKIIYSFLQNTNGAIFRRIKAAYYFKTWSITLGKNVRIYGLPNLIKIGDHTSIYANCIFEFRSGSELNIGTNVILSYGVVLCCHFKIIIGNDVQVGEYTSIRDSTHSYDAPDKPMKYSKDLLSTIIIENDVWIGRGCIILPDTHIESGVVVAANSVVKGTLTKNGIYGGTPAKFIKMRI